MADVGRPQLLALRNKAFVAIGGGGRFALPPLLEAYLRHRAAEDAVAWRRTEERHARWLLALLATWEAVGREGRWCVA
ncbi:MAG: hypothetical protein O3A02_03030 [bacterium]|nr:hypothetical protein [bacterium]